MRIDLVKVENSSEHNAVFLLLVLLVIIITTSSSKLFHRVNRAQRNKSIAHFQV